ncbi:MAG TPA: efflux RND transporter permease subunit [Candidatus Krumholzibacteria bacterium]|nr:efflux RND transporter permease subunit [Candidatus Krumholzibacteria bacterium]HRX49900.1 efflux RND transporter permease subunit [Candidatus Krumholzibacteria bacterium]
MTSNDASPRGSWLDPLLRFCLENKLVVALLVLFTLVSGVLVAPFDWDLGGLPRDPVSVDAIPDLGENQQIVFTEWMGRSPQDVEDQITYPLTVSLLGLPDVKTVRSYSFFGFSSIYVIFEEGADFYDSRSRILEKLSSLPAGSLPDGVQPSLGPDATALGQIFWYTLEGRDEQGNPAGGWDLDEIRSVQDWYVRYGLLAAEGVSEVASVGGFVREYQIDVDPAALLGFGVGIDQVFRAVQRSNVDVGARTIEINSAEYLIRGLGFLKSLEDIEQSVVTVRDDVPVTVADVATVRLGPALRRGALDKEGAEAVGGVVVVRYGENPLATIKNVKDKIEEISPGLPSRVLADGRVSKLTIVPFYDRSGLIYETLGTLRSALSQEILITIIVVIVLMMNLRSSLLVAGLLPLAVLMSFLGMKLFGVDANIVALSGIAIAIGTMVDMGVILCENILKRLDEAPPEQDRLEVVFAASSEVGGAVVTAVTTTIISFLPVFTMQAAEGKLFKPLAYTKTFALVASIIVALTVIPPFAHLLFSRRFGGRFARRLGGISLILVGAVATFGLSVWVGLALAAWGIATILGMSRSVRVRRLVPLSVNGVAVALVAVLLTAQWLPLGPGAGLVRNGIFVILLLGGLLGALLLFARYYGRLLAWCLDHKLLFLLLPAGLLLTGASVWLGFESVFGFLPGVHDDDATRLGRVWSAPKHAFPGLGKEFMPPLDEGSYLYMPTTMPHASIGEALDVLQKLDEAMASIPEVESVVGKLGRADSPLDPAPISMVETVINYLPEYRLDRDGRRLRYRYDDDAGDFARDAAGELIPDEDGRPYRQWRDEIRSPDDIWDQIVRAAKLPGTTSAPKLQPIAARIVMLQSGMRAPMGVKVKGPDLETIEEVGLQIEKFLKEVPSIKADAVIADRIVGKPYLEIDIDREAISRYGLTVRDVQDVLEIAVGGRTVTTTVEGRERYPVRVRYARELRDTIEGLEDLLVPTPGGAQIPLIQLAEIRYVRGPQVIKSEDTFLIGYVLFDKLEDAAEVDVVRAAQRHLSDRIATGAFVLPAGVSYSFAGSYENQVRSEKKLQLVLPLALFLIFLVLYFQFKSVATTSMVFSGIFVAWAGGFLMIWLYGQPWFMDFSVFGVGMRDLFQMHAVNLSVAIWVGFIALFGIASDDGVVMATYLDQTFAARRPATVAALRKATVQGANRRVRPAMMTTATTILALIPVLTSSGRGADIMVPMAIPSFGGMIIEILTILVVPVLYCGYEELKLKTASRAPTGGAPLDEPDAAG